MYNSMVATQPRPVRSTRAPLTMEAIRHAAPSAFATEAYSGMSARYAYIPTSDVIEGLIRAGFQPFAASQSRTKIADKREHTKHMIRFRTPDTMGSDSGEIVPEIVLINGHDGTTAYKFMAGLFRVVCTNGLVVADSLIGSVSIRHSGDVVRIAAQQSVDLIKRLPEALDTVAYWKSISLTRTEQGIFAEAAHTMRFADTDGKITTPVQPEALLQPRRYADNASDLWSTFNRVQEAVIKGGLSAYNPRTTTRSTTRPVKGIDQDVRLNKALWTLAEKMAELRG